ncbi:MAG: hypothetical protein ACRDLL_07420 [Solirubrobacterales bacterium]
MATNVGGLLKESDAPHLLEAYGFSTTTQTHGKCIPPSRRQAAGSPTE